MVVPSQVSTEVGALLNQLHCAPRVNARLLHKQPSVYWKHLGDQLRIDLPRAQIFHNNVMYCTFMVIRHICQHSNTPASTRVQNVSLFLYIYYIHFGQNVTLTGIQSGLGPLRSLYHPGTYCTHGKPYFGTWYYHHKLPSAWQRSLCPFS